MARVQLALNVADLEEAVEFYAKLFATEPAKRQPGYANFVVADPPLKLVLFENAGGAGRLNHVGIEVATTGEVSAHADRLRTEGLVPVEENGTCCYAVQDKVWVDGPDGAWEIYTVLDDSETFGTPSALAGDDADPLCCAAAPESASRCC